ncbi:HrcA family transcriptional regulator [Helicobacter sp. 11S03491-1]|uniref:HrcA family transcriptional regulator n=1 Tax=Helicobacter sp. 11S03491-1 TaxID=1476196 RepID=UPI000BA51AC6|nr:HrcA family transcriptional regulator [Helicobacter sp. 11S03491-1]PAF43760.1 hypothetical protein BKH45_00390 [Helicobacter sp. 11S03491-1]
MNRKKDLLLDKIIQRYIESQEPIGSESLKMSLSIKISSATIRNYFKVLSDEGILMQTHISSGRIPTYIALKNYWRNKIHYQDTCLQTNIQKFQKACQENGIFGIIKEKNTQTLKDVLNHDNQFLILVFEDDQIALPFNHSIERFVKELIGLEIEDIKKIAYQVCAMSLVKKLEKATQTPKLHYSGIKFLSFMLEYQEFQKLFFEIIEGKIFDKLDKGIYFEKTIPQGNIGIMQDIKLQEKNARMFCVGKLDKNYANFYEEIAS